MKKLSYIGKNVYSVGCDSQLLKKCGHANLETKLDLDDLGYPLRHVDMVVNLQF